MAVGHETELISLRDKTVNFCRGGRGVRPGKSRQRTGGAGSIASSAPARLVGTVFMGGVTAAGEDVTDEVYRAYEWLRENTF